MGRVTRWMATIGTIAAMTMAPSSAQALTPPLWGECPRADNAAYACNTQISELTYYKGWAHTNGGYCGGAAPSEEMLARANAPRPAWRWTGSRWTSASIPAQTRVYVWPYATAWSWVWTGSTGWLAIRDEHLVINPYCDPRIP